MTTKRLLIVQAVIVATLSLVFFLPKVANSTPQGVELTLPTYVGSWYGEDQQISEMELKALAKDTAFARKLYTDGRGHQIFASIVLSGQDLDNSIHRPERCLPAQGWSVADSRGVKIPLAHANMSELPVTRLHNVRKVPTNTGQTVPIYNLNYYWFVGWKDITASHLDRTYIDIRDRIVYGYNQRWAYITVASTITESFQKFGTNEQQTDAMLREFIQQLVPLIKTASESDATHASTTAPANAG